MFYIPALNPLFLAAIVAVTVFVVTVIIPKIQHLTYLNKLENLCKDAIPNDYKRAMKIWMTSHKGEDKIPKINMLRSQFMPNINMSYKRFKKLYDENPDMFKFDMKGNIFVVYIVLDSDTRQDIYRLISENYDNTRIDSGETIDSIFKHQKSCIHNENNYPNVVFSNPDDAVKYAIFRFYETGMSEIATHEKYSTEKAKVEEYLEKSNGIMLNAVTKYIDSKNVDDSADK